MVSVVEKNREGKEEEYHFLPVPVSKTPHCSVNVALHAVLMAIKLSQKNKRMEGQNDWLCWWAEERGWGTGAVSRLRWTQSWNVPQPLHRLQSMDQFWLTSQNTSSKDWTPVCLLPLPKRIMSSQCYKPMQLCHPFLGHNVNGKFVDAFIIKGTHDQN